MFWYIIKRVLAAIPVLIGVNLITFVLFFIVNTPDDMARMQLGHKHITPELINRWKISHGYDKPLFYNGSQTGIAAYTETLLYQKSSGLFTFDFGISDAGRSIGADIRERMWPSLAIAVPTLILGLAVNIALALLMVYFMGTVIDMAGLVICISLMSISGLFYIIAGQYWIAKLMHWVPISGYDTGLSAFKFIILPVVIGVFSSIGAGVRWYRSLFLEEMGKDYVRTARAKGLSAYRVLSKHVLGNALIPILTGIVVILPSLFMGSLIMESFFGIPGLGSYTIDAIQRQDFAVVRSMVYLGSVLYIAGLILTDISYAWVDPRIRFQ